MGAFWVLVFDVAVTILALGVLVVIARSFIVIGPAQVGLVTKRVSSRHNATDDPIAFTGEAGYQSDLLMPGVRFTLWPTYSVAKYPWVQVPAGEIYEAQIRSLGAGPTAALAIANAVSEGKITVVPEVLVTGGGGAIEGLAATFMRALNRDHGSNLAEATKPEPGLTRANS